MTDDRATTGSAAAEASVHDDDELAEVLAAELERYSTGSVPVLPRPPVPAPREVPMQPLAIPRAEAQIRPASPPVPVAVDEGAFARRAAEVGRAMRAAQAPVVPGPPGDPFHRPDVPTGRRSAPGPVLQPASLPTADDLPVKRRTGFRPPPTVAGVPPIEPLDRVLSTGPISLPEPTSAILDSMITGSIPIAETTAQHAARHAAPLSQPLIVPDRTAGQEAGTIGGSQALYADWEQSLRAIGRPRAPWDVDEEVVPTGGDPDLATVALPVVGTGSRPVDEAGSRRRAHALPLEPAPEAPPQEAPLRGRRSGRRRAVVPDDGAPAAAERPADLPEAPIAPVGVDFFAPPVGFSRPVRLPDQPGPEVPEADLGVADGLFDADEEGIDEVASEYHAVSAATTGAVDLPQVEPRPRTAPVLIERVRTALLQLPVIPPSPTGSGAAAIVGRWIGAFASPLTLVLAFGLAAAGSGPAAVVAVIAGALLAVPAMLRTAAWSARVQDDATMQETALLGATAGRAVAVVLLVARLGAAATVLFAAGSAAGTWVDRTGALGLGASSAALLGSTAVAVLAILCAALPARATAVVTLLVAVLGAVGTLLIALLLAPNGAAPVATTGSGVVAAAAGGFAGVGLLLVLCGADIARWRTDLAHPVSTAVGSAVAVLSGAALVCGGTLIAARLSGGGDAVDEFAGALSDASASLLAGPMLLILLVSSITLPALLLRSAGASAARLLGAGRPVRLGAVAAGLLALAGALGLLAGGVDPTGEAIAAAALCGAPVAAWAGVLMTSGPVRRPVVTGAGIAVAAVVAWLLSDGLLPGSASPVLDALALPASSGLRGGPAIGLAAALVIGVVAGALGGRPGATGGRPMVRPADTVEG
ncbi:MAG: hypothetical protein HIU86_09440 [Acidobacteria bacterium]|nr:hypothetical protein [Acidobacteriota bacterium]